MEENEKSIIPSGLDATDMRLRMETKLLLQQNSANPGSMYIGLGELYHHSDNNKDYVKTGMITPHQNKTVEKLSAQYKQNNQDSERKLMWVEDIPTIPVEIFGHDEIFGRVSNLNTLSDWCDILGIKSLSFECVNKIQFKLTNNIGQLFTYSSPMLLVYGQDVTNIQFVRVYMGDYRPTASYSNADFVKDDILSGYYCLMKEGTDYYIHIYLENNITQNKSFYGG